MNTIESKINSWWKPSSDAVTPEKFLRGCSLYRVLLFVQVSTEVCTTANVVVCNLLRGLHHWKILRKSLTFSKVCKTPGEVCNILKCLHIYKPLWRSANSAVSSKVCMTAKLTDWQHPWRSVPLSACYFKFVICRMNPKHCFNFNYIVICPKNVVIHWIIQQFGQNIVTFKFDYVPIWQITLNYIINILYTNWAKPVTLVINSVIYWVDQKRSLNYNYVPLRQCANLQGNY